MNAFWKAFASAALLAVRIVPVGFCRKGATGIWRNRRGGRIVLAGDVAANLGEWSQKFFFRVPEGAKIVRDGNGRIVWTVEPRDGGEGDGHGSV